MPLHVQSRSQTAHAPPAAPLDDALLLAPLDEAPLDEAPLDEAPLEDALLLAPLDEALLLAPDELADPEELPLAPLELEVPASPFVAPLVPDEPAPASGDSNPVPLPAGRGVDGCDSSGAPLPGLPLPPAPTAHAALPSTNSTERARARTHRVTRRRPGPSLLYGAWIISAS